MGHQFSDSTTRWRPAPHRERCERRLTGGRPRPTDAAVRRQARGYQHPTGEWNFEEVTVQGSKIRVELNGTLILDCDLANVVQFMADHPHPGKDRTKGHFGFAGHNDPVCFRNITLQEL